MSRRLGLRILNLHQGPARCLMNDAAVYRRTFKPSMVSLPLARYGGRQTVTLLPGDGIGPEMTEHVRRVFRVAQVPIDFEEVRVDSSVATDVDHAVVAVQRNGVALKGNIETLHDDVGALSSNVQLRARLDLFANLLHCRTLDAVPSRHRNIDMVLIRENTEGEYSGLEYEAVPGIVESLKIVTRPNIERIARFAFDYALRNHRKKLTAVHKANIMKIADGLFLHVCGAIAAEYPSIEFTSMIVDNASMQMVSRPQQFDVVLMPNLYGNVMANIACGLVGGPGLVSGSNLGNRYAIFETGTRNTGKSLEGRNLANPTAFLQASIDMLRYLQLDEAADQIQRAVTKTLNNSDMHTADIGGACSTSHYVDAVVNDIHLQMANK